MFKRQRTIIPLLVLLFALAVCTVAQAADKINPYTASLMLRVTIGEVQNWGAADGLQNFSLVGTWIDEAGALVKIEQQGKRYHLSRDYSEYTGDDWIAFDGDTMSINSFKYIRHAKPNPMFSMEGDIVSSWTYEGVSADDPFYLYSIKDSNLILTLRNTDDDVTPYTIKRDQGSIICTDAKGTVAFSLKPAGPDAKAAPDSWKYLQAYSISDLTDMVNATYEYAAKHADKCPPMTSSAVLCKALADYDSTIPSNRQYASQMQFKCNPALSGRTTESFKKADGVVLYYDPEPWPDGSRCVVMASVLSSCDVACIKTVSKAEWEKLAKINKFK